MGYTAQELASTMRIPAPRFASVWQVTGTAGTGWLGLGSAKKLVAGRLRNCYAPGKSRAPPSSLGLLFHSRDLRGDLSMKLINPKLGLKFAAAACLFGMLAAPAAVFAGHRKPEPPPPPPWYHKPTPTPARLPEPSTLAMILVGTGFGIGLTVVEMRRNKSRSVAA